MYGVLLNINSSTKDTRSRVKRLNSSREFRDIIQNGPNGGYIRSLVAGIILIVAVRIGALIGTLSHRDAEQAISRRTGKERCWAVRHAYEGLVNAKRVCSALIGQMCWSSPVPHDYWA
jgi:hypothetical protein